ncbi:MAG: hypothetical protein U0N15_11575 [Bifidobacterium choerinum]
MASTSIPSSRRSAHRAASCATSSPRSRRMSSIGRSTPDADAGSSRTGPGARRASSSCTPCPLSSCESMLCFQFRTTSALTPSSSPIRRLVASPDAYLAAARRRVGSSTGARRSLRRSGSSSSIQRANTSWLGYPSARSVRRRHRPCCR